MLRLRQTAWPWSLASILILFTAWYLGTLNAIPTTIFPNPEVVALALTRLVTKGFAGRTLFEHFSSSMVRLFFSFLLAILIGVPVGLAMGMNRFFHGLVNPWMQIYRPVPSIAYMSLLVIWLGVEESSRITLLTLAGLPPIVLGACSAIEGIRRERLEGARSLGLRGAKLFRLVILPSCLPEVLTSIRIASSGIFTTLIAAEMIGSRAGLGSMIIFAANRMELGIVVSGVIILGLIGVIVDRILRIVQKICVPWYYRS